MTTTFIDAGDRETVNRQITTLRKWDTRGLRVVVAYGGLSAEDRLYLDKSPVEQLSVTALRESLAGLGAEVEVVDPCAPGFIKRLAGAGVVLSNLHGPFGEDGRLQGLLDFLRVPYCGSSVAACSLAADKILCKEYMRGLGVPTPAWREWTGGPPLAWDGPVMVKPPLGGSSVGMSLVDSPGDFARALAEAAGTDPSPSPRVLVEQIVTGTPVTVGMLELPGGVVVFPPLATEVHAGTWYDAESKLDAAGEGTVSVSAAELPAQTVSTLTEHARTMWERLDCRGMARVDFMVEPDGNAFALEVNPTPGMSVGSNFAAGAELVGVSHADAVRAVLREAVTRRTYDVPLSPDPLLTAAVSER
ncbi:MULTISPECIES: D-alanine--D-alanine ligase family protein [Streptomycetaceae]|uniref:D-alanine--D-alanine ligase family protein n=1 Tax=Streptomycetaceae TaxID=2062 RepID=UPI00300B90EF